MITHQVMINAIYQAADEKGENGWNWLVKAGLTFLVSNRNAIYAGPAIEDIATLNAEEQQLIRKYLPELEPPAAEAIYTNQDVINAVFKAARERGQEGWEWLSKAGLTFLVDNRDAIYTGPPLAEIASLSDEERSLITRHLSGVDAVPVTGKYIVQFYQGDYPHRQRQAIADNCTAYVEHHFNAGPPTANYALVITPDPNPSHAALCSEWGRWYAGTVARSTGIIGLIPWSGGMGVKVGGFSGRGNGNIRVAGERMPALLLEPLFASTPAHAQFIRTEFGQGVLARVLSDSIRQFFPEGGKIAFSVGHKYKTSNPVDRGVMLHGGGTEADHAELVLIKAAQMLG